MSKIIQSRKGEHVVAGVEVPRLTKGKSEFLVLAGKGLAYYAGEKRTVVGLRESVGIFARLQRRWIREGNAVDWESSDAGILGWLNLVAKALPK